MACGAIRKPPEPNRRLEIRVTGTTFETDHGFRFSVLPESTANLVRVDFRYPVGSVDDPKGKEGLAHLVEHLLFEVEYSVGEARTSIAAELSKVALSTNASTAKDHTTFVTYAAPNALDTIFGLEAHRLAIGCGGLTADIVAREREVVLNELRQRQGGSGAGIERAIYDAIYSQDHPYRPIDTIESVGKLELADVCAFIAGPYQRGRASIVVSGATDVAAVQKAAGRHLGRMRKRTATARPVIPVAVNRPGSETLRVDVEEPTLVVTWPLPAVGTRAYHLLQLAWPFIAPRMEAFGYMYGWGHSASTTTFGGSQAPVLAVSITLTSASKRGEAIDAAEKSVEHAGRMMGENKDVPRWKLVWQARAQQLLGSWESLAGRNVLAADLLDQSGTLLGRLDELAKATPTEVRDLIVEWLGRNRARYLLLEPSGAGGSRSIRTYAGGAEAHGARVDPALADRPMAVPFGTTALAVKRYALRNGLTVVLWPHGTSPLVHGRLVIDSGSVHEPSGKEGTSLLVGADDVYPDSMVFESRVLSNYVDTLVELLAGELRAPGYELDDDGKKFLRGRLQRRRAKARRDYERDILVAAYGERHPYARSSMTEDSIDNIHRDSVMQWAGDHIVANNATLILAGKFDDALVKRHVAYNADHVKAGSNSRVPDVEPEPRTFSWIRGTATTNSPTVEIDVVFPAGRGMDTYHAQRLVLALVLESRLSALRAKHAVTYGFSATYSPRLAGGLWRISGEADASRAGEAASLIAAILDEMRRDPESYRADFVLARQKVMQSILLMGSDSRSVADRLVEVAGFGLADDFYDKVLQSVAKLTLGSFKFFVASELAPDKQVFGAFGNADAVADAIKAAQRTKPE